jgi:hypothetical protein
VTVTAQPTTPAAAESEYELDAVVADRRVAAEGVVVLTLCETVGEPLPPWEPGAHVDLLLPVPGGETMTRQYSLCSDPADRYEWQLGVLREPAGRGGSAHVHDALRPGSRVRVQGPRNHFPMLPSPRYLFIAGGIGITAIRTMVAAAEAAGAEWELVYGGRTRTSMAFLHELGSDPRVTVGPQDETRARVDDSAGSLDPRCRRGGRGHRALLVQRRHVRHLRDGGAGGRAGAPRLRAHRRGAGGQRLHDDLRLSVALPSSRARPLEGIDR